MCNPDLDADERPTREFVRWAKHERPARPEPRRVSHEFCLEDRERIDKLMATVGDLAQQLSLVLKEMRES